MGESKHTSVLRVVQRSLFLLRSNKLHNTEKVTKVSLQLSIYSRVQKCGNGLIKYNLSITTTWKSISKRTLELIQVRFDCFYDKALFYLRHPLPRQCHHH